MPRDFFMRFFLISVFLIMNSWLMAQEETTINHYQKKWETDSIHRPCEIWDSRDLLIVFPDSSCTNGIITVKKLVWQNTRGYSYRLTFTNHMVKEVIIEGKGKKKQVMLSAYREQLTSEVQKGSCYFKVELDQLGRRSRLKCVVYATLGS